MSMQKIEAMIMKGPKVQAVMAEDDTPSDVSRLTAKEKAPNHLLDSVASHKECKRTCSSSSDDIKHLIFS